MGNTPSSGNAAPGHPNSPLRARSPTQSPRPSSSNTASPRPPVLPHHRLPSTTGQASPPLRQEGTVISPTSARPGSPRRRKSLELPDLNRLTFTPALPPGVGVAPVFDDAPSPSLGLGQGNKRISITTGTRAASGTGVGGMPIPGAGKPVRRWAAERERDRLEAAASAGMGMGDSHNPYFPSIPAQAAAKAQELPDYSNSPSSSTPAAPSRVTDDSLILPVPAPTQQVGRQPTPAKVAPAIVTLNQSHTSPPPSLPSSTTPSPSQHELPPAPQHLNPPIQSLLVSSLPEGSTPAFEVPPTLPLVPISTYPGPSELLSLPEVQENRRDREEGQAGQERGTIDGLVPTLVSWNGGGKDVFVTGTFAQNGWKTRLKMEKSTHDFTLLVNLPPGTHRLKFIVDDHWRCSNDLQTATDGDGNLVNWLEVEVPRRGSQEENDWAGADWVRESMIGNLEEADDPSLWTSEIPPALIHFQSLEERALLTPPSELPPSHLPSYQTQQQSLLSLVPTPPTLPRHLEKVILNTTLKELEGTVGGAGGDDTSILPVPNHVTLQHLTASAIRNGVLAVGTTTRYRKKYVSTLIFKSVE